MRRLKLAIGAMLLLAIPVTLAAAQAPVPTVAVTASGSSITLTPSGQLAAGPTRFTFAGKGEFVLATLRAGVTVDQARQAVSRSGDAALSLVFLEASVPEPGREVTVDLRPNTTYVAVSLAGRSSSLTTFATGAPSGARAPAPDARIRMVDYAFKGPNTLPRNGRIRVANQGTTLHFALAFPLRPGVTNKRFGRALRSGNDKAMGRIVAGPPLTVQGLISQGTTNDNVVRFPRKGPYAMVCFFGEHNRLGMYRVYKVR